MINHLAGDLRSGDLAVGAWRILAEGNHEAAIALMAGVP
jgi:hypothetical protein